MTTVLDSSQATSPRERLQATMAAVRLSFHWLGSRKALNPQQRDQAADSFGAEGKFLSAGKKLLDTSHPAFRNVTAIRSRALAYWKGTSLPFPEPGIRLIRQDAITAFDQEMAIFRDQLAETVEQLDRQYDELRDAARRRLGELFHPGDYPPSLVGQFAIEHDFPSVEPPNYLKTLNPYLYRAECERMQSRFDEAVHLAETAFTEELTKLVDHLTERLSGSEDGKPKVFKNSAIDNLVTFFVRFRQLNIGSNQELEELVEQAQQAVRGVLPQQLREDQSLRQRLAGQMAAVQASLDQYLVDRPRRAILRRPR
ncbi:hypothetical protein GC197_09915 [bacterium]|nr:hypothetical protein [bacterium]